MSKKTRLSDVLDYTPVPSQFGTSGVRALVQDLTDLEYEITLIDRATGAERRYRNPAGNVCGEADTTAFPGATGELALPSAAPRAERRRTLRACGVRTSRGCRGNSSVASR